MMTKHTKTQQTVVIAIHGRASYRLWAGCLAVLLSGPDGSISSSCSASFIFLVAVAVVAVEPSGLS